MNDSTTHATDAPTANQPAASRPVLIVLSGLSGSGKSVALRTLEDLDFNCVDNLPAALLPEFVRSVAASNDPYQRLAVGIDVRNRDAYLTDMPQWLSAVGALGFDHRLVFFDTTDEVLLKRYSETRRRHRECAPLIVSAASWHGVLEAGAQHRMGWRQRADHRR